LRRLLEAHGIYDASLALMRQHVKEAKKKAAPITEKKASKRAAPSSK
jgi:hypothetical protein